MIKPLTIKLLPTEWELDVFIVREAYDHNLIPEAARRSLAEEFVKLYGANFEYYYEDLERINAVLTVTSTDESESKGHTRIVLIINPILTILVHELWHVLFHLSKQSGLELNYDSQEWGACMIESLFSQIAPHCE